MALIKTIAKNLLPPICLPAVNMLRWNHRIRWIGNFSTWDGALDHCDGYDSNLIFEKVKSSTEKVIIGEIPCERDSVPLKEIEYSWPLIAGISLASTFEKGNFELVDFGGSLGSVYFQCRKIFKGLPIRWHIVEQSHYVDYAKTNINIENLQFHYTLEEVFKNSNPSTIIFSSVLQYLEFPYKLFDQVFELGFRHIIIDRTPFYLKKEDQIKIQKVPAPIYKASYPCWIFSDNKFETYLEKKYDLIEKFKNPDNSGNSFYFGGYIFRKKP